MTSCGTAPDTLAVKQIRYFLFRLKRIYGAAYKVQFPNQTAEANAIEEWGEHITRLSRPQMDAGFGKLKTATTEDPERWKFPRIGAVINLCKPTPADLGLPEEYDAWQEVQNHSHEPLEHSWSHRAVFIAGQYTRWFDIRNATLPEQRREIKKRFYREYQRVMMRLFITGSEMPMEALENQSVDLTPLEKSQRHHEQQLLDTMKQQGIDPNGGRKTFLNGIRQLGLHRDTP